MGINVISNAILSKPGTTHQELLVIKQEIYKPTFQLIKNSKLELKLILFSKLTANE
jgi:hypothetical protein